MDVFRTVRNYPFPIIRWALFAAGSIFLFIGITNNTLWYDEAFTGALVRHSFTDVVRIAAGDNHPPFYFLLTKFLTVFFGNNEFSLRSASLLGVVALAALGLGPVKRIWGERAGLLFTLFTFMTPVLAAQALNARMYTWAAFFCTACVLYGYLAVTENRLIDWSIFGIVTILGLYTHIYLMLECFLVYGLMFLWLVIRDRKKLLTFISISAIVALLYLPWVFVVIRQASEVAKEFWIPSPLSPWILFGTLFMPFQHEFGSTVPQSLLLISCILAGGLLVAGTVHAVKKRGASGFFFFICFALSILTFAGAFTISLVLKPILMPRYLTSLMGLYILLWVYGLEFLPRKSHKIIATVLILAVFIPQLVDIKTVKRNGPVTEIMEHFNGKICPTDGFVHNDEHSFGIFSYYYPQHRHYLLLKQGFTGYGNYTAFAPSGIAGHYYGSFVRNHPHVWLVNRTINNPPQYPAISNKDFELYGKLYRTALDTRFTQSYSFLNLSITAYSSDEAEKLNEAALFTGDMKNLRITAQGFKNNNGKAVISIYNRAMYEISVNYIWQNKTIEQIGKETYDSLVTNNTMLPDEDKVFLSELFTLDENSKTYTLTKSLSGEDSEKLSSIYTKLTHVKQSDITEQKALFTFDELPKGLYYIVVIHDENENHYLDYENNLPTEGLAVSGSETSLQGEPTFDSNYIVLGQDEMETVMPVFYY